MGKPKLKILVVDRPLRPKANVVTVFDYYKTEGYELIVFPFREDKRRTEIVFFSSTLIDNLEKLLNIRIDYDEDNPFYDFDMEEVDEDAIYDILDQYFDLEVFNLSVIEK